MIFINVLHKTSHQFYVHLMHQIKIQYTTILHILLIHVYKMKECLTITDIYKLTGY